MHKGLYILIFLFSFFEVGISYGQDSEHILNTEGIKLFDNEDFVSATPIYLQLLALQPRSPEYNYKYGACLLFNSTDRKSAIKYLEFATANEQVNPEAYYFMGKAFHLNYQFDKAISFYEKYQSKAKIKKSWEVKRQIESCRNGKKLLKNISEIVVFEKKSTLASFFYSAYDLSGIGGDIVISDVDQSRIDKRKSHRPLIYFPPNASRVFFGSYGDSELGGKNIYFKDKNPDGSWSKPVLVPGEVNSEFDEDYPFMDVKNGYLYFSSKGHNSMGGYDIFKSKYNSETKKFEKPENLDFAISSTDNDLLYLKDDSGDFAWFASSRQSKDGKIDVYKVRQERASAPVAAIQGTFNSVIHPQNKKLNIEVKELSSNKILGTFYTDDNGTYLITFPKNGKYEYTINIFGSPKPFTEIITISASEQMSLLKQKLIHSEKENQEIVELTPILDNDDTTNSDFLAEIMKSRAELNPNSTLFENVETENYSEIEAILAELNMKGLSAFEVASKTLELIDIQDNEREKNQILQQKSYQIISENNQQIIAFQLEVKNAVAKIHGVIEESEKQVLLNQAADNISRINELEKENKQLMVFADSIQQSISAWPVSENELKIIEKELKKAQSIDDAAIFNAISKHVAVIQKLQVQSKGLKNNLVQSEIVALTEVDRKNKEIIKVYEGNANSLKNEIQLLEEQKAASKSKKQEEIQIAIEAKRNDLNLIENGIKNIQEKDNQNSKILTAKNVQLNFIQMIEKEPFSTTIRIYSNVEKEIKSVDSQNFRTLKSYVNQQIEKSISSDTLEVLNTEMISELELKEENESEVNSNVNKELGDSQLVSVESEKIEAQEILTYEDELAKIESNTKLNTKQKGEAILKSEFELQRNLSIAIEETQTDLSENPSDENTLKRYENLVDEKEKSESRASEQSQVLIATEAIKMDANKLLSKLDPSYTKDILKIEKSKTDNQLDQLIQRESQLQKQLKEQSEINQKRLNSSNTISFTAENQVINSLVEASEKRVETHKNQIELATLTTSENANPNEYIAQKESFRSTILGEKSNFLTGDFDTESTLKEQQKVISDYHKVLENRLDEIRTLTKTNSSSAVQEDLDWVIDELKQVENKIAKVTNKLTKIQSEKETLQAQNSENKDVNQTSENANSKKYIAQKENFRSTTLAEKSDFLTGDFDRELTLKEQQKVISDYHKVLENRLDEIRTLTKTNSSFAVQEDLDWTIDELKQVENKIAEVTNKLTKIQSKKETLQAENSENKDVNQTSENANSKKYIAQKENFRSTTLAEKSDFLTGDFDTELTLKEQQKVISDYHKVLENRLDEIRTLTKTNSSFAVQEDLDWTIDELKQVENKIAEVTNKLTKIQSEKETLQAENSKNKVVNTTPLDEEIDVVKTIESIKNTVQKNQKTITKLEESASESSKIRLKNIELSIEKFEKEVDEISKVKEEIDKVKLLIKLVQEQLLVEEQLVEIETEESYRQSIILSNNVGNLKETELKSVSQLEAKQRRFRIEIGELTSHIKELDSQIASLNKRKAKNLVIERNEKQALLVLTESELKEIENELAIRNTSVPAIVNSAVALKKNVTFKAESLMAQTKEYKQIQSEYKEINDLNAQITKNLSELELKRKEIEVAILESQATGIDVNESISITSKLKQINALNTSLEAIEIKRDALQETFNENLQNINDSELIQNLLFRGVSPISVPLNKANNLIFKEFKILAPQEKMIRPKISLDEEKPTGLFYRVQVGAFAKPINETLFSEFTPVSGEKLNNGITRYMVGYFNKREDVMGALEKVRKLGYKDAFPVAYCDGERISMFEAKRLEEAGLCLPQGTNEWEIVVKNTPDELMFSENEKLNQTQNEVVENKIVEKQPREKIQPNIEEKIQPTIQKEADREDLSSELKKLAAYNKAPGAAFAYAVETRLGLFFTVQVGVYNKPVPSSQLFEIKPLLTQRLDNGQVRYSTGIFHTIPEARPKREEAVLLGITDAYITAYYQGKRITIQEARTLLAEKGESILEPIKMLENKTLTETEWDVVELKKIKEEDVNIENFKVNVATSKQKIQFVSKKQYESFPIDVLKRYNQKGDFYYDTKDQRVKSMIYNASNLPSIYGFREDVDTLIVKTKTRQETTAELILKVELQQTTLPGEIGDWLLRFGYLRELKVVDNRIQLTVFGITNPIDYEFLLGDLRSLGFELVPEIQE